MSFSITALNAFAAAGNIVPWAIKFAIIPNPPLDVSPYVCFFPANCSVYSDTNNIHGISTDSLIDEDLHRNVL